MRCIVVPFHEETSQKSITVNSLQCSAPKTDGRETIAAASHNCAAHMVEEDLEKLTIRCYIRIWRPFVSADSFVSLADASVRMTLKY